ncbi:MAG: PqqD family protein [Anaerolineaceae bacterium]|nr:PqqD family protein [Anaerolineaceae bacterium]
MEDKKPLRNQDFRLEKMDDELLLFNPKSTNILYLNETASLIWQLCDGQRSVNTMIDLLSESFPEAELSIKKDVEETITLFSDHGAILFV